MNRNQNQKNQLRALRLMLAPVWVGFQAFKPGLSPGSEMGEASNLAACMGGRISGTWWPGRKRGRVGNLFDKIGDGAKLVEFNGNENSIVNFKAPKINSPRLVELLPDTCDCAGLSLWNLTRGGLNPATGFLCSLNRSLTHNTWALDSQIRKLRSGSRPLDTKPGGLKNGLGPLGLLVPRCESSRVGNGLGWLPASHRLEKLRSSSEVEQSPRVQQTPQWVCCTNRAEPSRTGAQASIRPEPVQGPSQSFPQPVPGLVNPAGLAPVPFGLGNLI